MSELTTPRLMAAAKEFNIGKDTLVDFLVSKGFTESFNPSTKLTETMYRVLQSEFQQDKAAKEKAERVELVKTGGNSENKKKRDEEDLSFKKKETAKPAEQPKAAEPELPAEVIEAPVAVVAEVPKKETAPVAVATEEAAPAVTKIDAPEITAPKVIRKIDLDAVDSSTRPKKAAKKAEEPKAEAEVAKPVAKKETKKEEAKPKPAEVIEEKKVEPKVELKPVVEEVKEDLPPVIENIQAAKLTGPKILGKIELPVDNDTRPKKDDNKRQRKRIPIEKKGGNGQQQQGQGQGQGTQNRGGSNIGGGQQQGGQRQG